MNDEERSKDELLYELIQLRDENRKLKFSEEKYQKLIKYAPSLIYELDLQSMRFSYVNDLACELTGYSRSELLVMSPFDIIDDQCKIAFQARYSQLLNEEVTPNVEYKVKCKDGRVIDVLLNIIFEKDENGKPLKSTVIGQDITERNEAEERIRVENVITSFKMANEALIEREERLNVLMDYNPSLVFLKDECGRYVYLNKTYEQQFVGSKDWYGKTDFDFWSKESAELFRANDLAVLETGQVTQYLEDSKDLDGTRYCWLNYKFPYTDSKNRRYSGGIGIDVTKRILAEEALRKAEEELRCYAEDLKRREEESLELIDGFTEGSWIVDCVAGTIKCSEKWAKRIGLDLVPEGERLSYTHTLPHPEDTAGVNSLQHYMEAGAARFDLEYRVKTVDCGYIWTQNRGKIIYNELGQAVKLYAATIDITERKRAEKELQDYKLHLEELVWEATKDIEEVTRQKLDLLDSISDCFYSLDQDLRFTYVNKAAEMAWGLSSAELIGKNIEEVFPSVIEISLSKFRQVLADKIPQHYELFSNVTKSWVYMNVYPTKDGISVFWQDINELKETQFQLQKSQQDVAEILASIKDPFFTLDANWNFTYVNQPAREKLSHFGSMVGENIWTLFPKMAGSIFWDKYHEVMNSKKPLFFEAESSYIGLWWEVRVYPFDGGISILFRDITKNKQAEEALLRSEKRFRALVTASSEVLYHMSPDWSEMIQINSTGFLANNDKPNSSWLQEYIPPDDQPLLTSVFNEAINTKSTFELEHHVWQADGSIGWTFSRAIPVLNEKGEIIEWFGAASDITKRKSAEEGISKERQRLFDVLETLHVNICLLTPDYHIIFANRAFKETFGEAKGRSCYDYICGLDEPCECCQVLRVLETGQPIQWLFTAPDGRIFDAYDYPFTDIDGKSLILELNVDISERKRAEEALRESEEKYYSLFENSLDGIILNYPDGTILDANPAACRMFGWSKDELCRLGRLGIVDIEDPRVMKAVEERSRTGRFHSEMTLIRNDGTRFEGEVTSNLYKDSGGKLLSSMIVRDVSARKHFESEMSRLDRLNLVGEMAAGIGHEIRNPMTSVRGFLQMLGNKEEYRDDRDYFDLMLDELDRANKIISEFLAMAKDKKVDLQPGSLDAIITALYPMIQSDANQREVAVELDLNYPTEPLIDANEIRQLILNMVRNGMEAMQSGGKITIGTISEGHEIVLYIKDKGQGLSLEMQDNLGTPFFTTKETGTGLGLPICYSIAARHNARIEYETGPDGTTFYVRFPVPVEQVLPF